MLKRTVRLLSKLSEEQPISCSTLSKIMDVSDRTIRYDIEQLNIIGKENGFEIKSLPHYGYQLVITNRELLNAFKKDNKKNEVPVEEDDKTGYIASRIIQSDHGLSLHQIEDILVISSSSAKKIIKEIEKIFAAHELSLQFKKGFYSCEGCESKLRECLIELLIQYKIGRYYRNFDIPSHEKIRRYIYTLFKNHHVSLPEVSYNNFLIYLFTDLSRKQKEHFLDDIQVDYSEDSSTLSLIHDICNFILKENQIQLNQTEMNLLAYRLLGLQMNYSGKLTDNQKGKVKDIVMEGLGFIDRHQNTSFIHDETLIQQLMNHMTTLQYRLQYGTLIDNPLKKEIFLRYPTATSYANIFSEVLFTKYHHRCNEVEISYLAIIFRSALERIVPKKRLHILLISESTNGMVTHLQQQILKYFDNYIESITLMDDITFRDSDLSDYDLIFTTTDAVLKHYKNAVCLHLIMEESQIQRIQIELDKATHFATI